MTYSLNGDLAYIFSLTHLYLNVAGVPFTAKVEVVKDPGGLAMLLVTELNHLRIRDVM